MKLQFLTATVISAMSLTGCVTIDDVAMSASPPSPKLRNAIAQASRDVLFDPYSVRDAEISYVVDLPGSSDAVCVKLNAKNRMGGYTGRQVQSVFIENGNPVSVGPNPHLCRNPKLMWTPFPEIEAL